MTQRKKVGVVLFQLGGPDSPDAIEPFLYNLFCDPDILPLGPFGALARKPLARWISWRRSKVVAQHYDEIGGHSPIRLLTERQAERLAAALRPHVEARVVVAMRYWYPLTAEAALLERLGIRRAGLHAFRHTNATMMDQLGAPVKVRQQRLGHSDARITLDTHTHEQ